MLEKYLPQTASEYIACFRSLAAMTNKHMNELKGQAPIEPENLKRLAEAVETISSLRGDCDIFTDSRPEGLTEFQKEMYSTEDTLRQQLLDLGYVYPPH